MKDAESVQFLIHYLEQSVQEKDDYSVAWVALQANMEESSSVEDIRKKLQRILESTKAASRFGV
jgi:hypothetical protein